MKSLFIAFGLFCASLTMSAQGYWQQKVDYKMAVDFDHTNHQYTGKQTLTYFNQSPEEINQVFYHLYFNAFQPGSAMDERSRNIEDPDPRVGSRISKLTPAEQGYLHVKSLKMDGKTVSFVENETILEVMLPKSIPAGGKAVFEMEFVGQVPLQIRRSGRNNSEGIDYSMSQWYPKMCEYDEDGWHPNPYIGREFYGVWGDFDVQITMDKSYMIGATGELLNPAEIGKGFTKDESKIKLIQGSKLTWKWKAVNVHDFVWAADPDFVHDQIQVPDGPMIHFFYQADPAYVENWKKLPEFTSKAFQHLSKHFGKYPYPVYSVIQGGDGGMEYPMATLITGNRKLPSLVGVTVHEAAHSWYQGVLATNESLYPWMDEGFTSYASAEVMDQLFASPAANPHDNAYADYSALATDGKEEVLSTHADHYNTNHAYGSASYSKGEVYLAQLGYIVGEEMLDQIILRYFETWKFKHPDANDFIRVAEKESGMVLDWYNEYFVNTTKTIDYAISGLMSDDQKTEVVIERKGLMPMPLEVEVVYTDQTKELFYLPLDIMRGEKKMKGYNGKWTIMSDVNWVKENIVVTINKPSKAIESITIDPTDTMADIDRSNNSVQLEEGIQLLMINR